MGCDNRDRGQLGTIWLLFTPLTYKSTPPRLATYRTVPSVQHCSNICLPTRLKWGNVLWWMPVWKFQMAPILWMNSAYATFVHAFILHHSTVTTRHEVMSMGKELTGQFQCQFRLSGVSYMANNNIAIHLNSLTSQQISLHIRTEIRRWFLFSVERE